MGQIIPRGAALAVVLAHRLPLPLAEIGAPLAPILQPVAAFLDALALGVGELWHGGECYCFVTICVSSCQASSVQATDQACAGAPRGWCGASPSKISPIVPTP